MTVRTQELRDVVYLVGHDRSHESLRYSLRTLALLSHGRVWLVGERPGWARNVEHIPGPEPGRTKWDRLAVAMWRACDSFDISEEFVYMNDDFFLLERVGDLPPLHRGPIGDGTGVANSVYRRGQVLARKWLEEWGVLRPLNYEMHTPMVIDRESMLKAMTLVGKMPAGQARTIYGNLAGLEGIRSEDVKVFGRTAHLPSGPFVSTNDVAFAWGKAGRELRSRFSTPGYYEEAP